MGNSGSSALAILDLNSPKYLFPKDEGRRKKPFFRVSRAVLQGREPFIDKGGKMLFINKG